MTQVKRKEEKGREEEVTGSMKRILTALPRDTKITHRVLSV